MTTATMTFLGIAACPLRPSDRLTPVAWGQRLKLSGRRGWFQRAVVEWWAAGSARTPDAAGRSALGAALPDG